MDAWLLLLGSGGMAWITVEMVRWLASLRKLKQEDMDKLVGLDMPAPVPREARPLVILGSLYFVLFLVLMSGALTIALAIATIRAFSSAL